MTPSALQACYARANEVLNGFKKPSERNARDVVALIAYINHLKPSQSMERDTQKRGDFQAVKDLFGL